jgi:hypothetical protein
MKKLIYYPMKTPGLIRKKQQTDNNNNITIISAIIISSILLLVSSLLFSLTMYPLPSQKALAQQQQLSIDNKTGMMMDPESGTMMMNNSKNGKLMMMDPKSNIMMMIDNATGMMMVMDPESGKMYSATGMMMVMDPESGKVMIKDRRCGMASISVMDILKVFTPC